MPTNKQQREAARRRLQRQLESRREADLRRRKTLVGVTVVGVLLLVVVVIVATVVMSGGSSTPVAAAPAKTAASCTFTPSGQAARPVKLPPASPPTTGTVGVSMVTNQGTVTMTLNRAQAPCSVDSVLSLVNQKYYNNTPCHRLVTAGIFVLQCGDPTGTGTGGPGYTVPDEATGSEQYPAGTIAMARTQQPNSTGSQFFIVYQDSPSLQQSLGKLQYTVVGKVTAGLGVVTTIAAGGTVGGTTPTDGKPKIATQIETMTVTSGTTGVASGTPTATPSVSPSGVTSTPSAPRASGSPIAS